MVSRRKRATAAVDEVSYTLRRRRERRPQGQSIAETATAAHVLQRFVAAVARLRGCPHCGRACRGRWLRDARAGCVRVLGCHGLKRQPLASGAALCIAAAPSGPDHKRDPRYIGVQSSSKCTALKRRVFFMYSYFLARPLMFVLIGF
jgi:hypothetical protein